jgi:hypothetical protein
MDEIESLEVVPNVDDGCHFLSISFFVTEFGNCHYFWKLLYPQFNRIPRHSHTDHHTVGPLIPAMSLIDPTEDSRVKPSVFVRPKR